MEEVVVRHKIMGSGIVTSINGDYIFVKFGNTEKQFMLKGFDRFFTYEDASLSNLIEEANVLLESNDAAPNDTSSTWPATKTPVYKATTTPFAGILISSRAQTIDIPTMELFFEVLGYIANPKHVSSFEAEVPKDGRDKEFEKLFPGQKYRPIELGETPSGMPNKISTQYRINFTNTHNCPRILQANMGAGNGSCVGRINKSGFVFDLVRNYGFSFGTTQDYSKIKKIAEDKGFLEDFERGYSL